MLCVRNATFHSASGKARLRTPSVRYVGVQNFIDRHGVSSWVVGDPLISCMGASVRGVTHSYEVN